MFITENYRKPGSFFKWLLCHSNDPAVSGVEYRTAIAYDVRFISAHMGSAARAVAICSRAEGSNVELSVPTHAYPLKFDGNVCTDPEGTEVKSFATAYFLSDKIFVVPNVSEGSDEEAEQAAT